MLRQTISVTRAISSITVTTTLHDTSHDFDVKAKLFLSLIQNCVLQTGVFRKLQPGLVEVCDDVLQGGGGADEDGLGGVL